MLKKERKYKLKTTKSLESKRGKSGKMYYTQVLCDKIGTQDKFKTRNGKMAKRY